MLECSVTTGELLESQTDLGNTSGRVSVPRTESWELGYSSRGMGVGVGLGQVSPSTTLLEIWDERPTSLESAINDDSGTIQQLLNGLRGERNKRVHTAIIKRIVTLRRLAQEEDDPNSARDVERVSVASFVELLSRISLDSIPEIGLTDSGTLTAEWRSSAGAAIALHFRADGRISYAIRGQAGATDHGEVTVSPLARLLQVELVRSE